MTREDYDIVTGTLYAAYPSWQRTHLNKSIMALNGRVYAVCIYEASSTDQILLLWYDPPYDDNWNFEYLTSDTGGSAKKKFSASIAMGPDGKVNIAYSMGNQASFPTCEIRCIIYDPETESVDSDTQIVSASNTNYFPCIDVDDNNDYHIVWSGNGYGTYTTRLQVLYKKKGSSVVNLTDLDSDCYSPWINIRRYDNYLHVYWIGYGTSSYPSVKNIRRVMYTTSWQPAEDITDQASSIYYGHSVFDEHGNIYLAYGITSYVKYMFYNQSSWTSPETAISSSGAILGVQASFINISKYTKLGCVICRKGGVDLYIPCYSYKNLSGTWSTPLDLPLSSTTREQETDISFVHMQREVWFNPKKTGGGDIYWVFFDDSPSSATYHLYFTRLEPSSFQTADTTIWIS